MILFGTKKRTPKKHGSEEKSMKLFLSVILMMLLSACGSKDPIYGSNPMLDRSSSEIEAIRMTLNLHWLQHGVTVWKIAFVRTSSIGINR